MVNSNIFESEFGRVEFIEKDNIVLLSWKKFCCGDDYRIPAAFALNLLKKYPGSNLIVDARNGFEDAKEDAEWGFTVLIPQMADTDCRKVAFIMQEVNDIEGEMDMWTKEFGKHFAVTRAESYEAALRGMREFLQVNVTYTIKEGCREEFYNKVKELGIIKASMQEPGNYKYDYYFPVEEPDKIFLMELWVNEAAQAYHGKTEHYQKLQLIKKDYVTDMKLDKFYVTDMNK